MVDKSKAFFQKLTAYFGLKNDATQDEIDAVLDAQAAQKEPPKPETPEPTEMEKAVAAAVAAQVAPLQAKIVELESRPNGAVQLLSLADVEKAGGLDKMKADYAAYQKELVASHYPYTAR